MKYLILSQEVENEEEDAMLAGYSEYLERIGVSFEIGMSLPLEDMIFPIEIFVEEASLRGRMTDALYLDDVECLTLSEKAFDFFEEKNIRNIEKLTLTLIDPYFNTEEVEEAKLKDEHLDYKEVIYDNYAIANVVGLADCVDHEASELEYYMPRPEIPDDMPEEMKEAMQQEEDNDIDFIRKLVLDESKIPDGLKIFRLKDCPRILVFREEVVNAIREEGLTGFVFVPLDKYTDEIPDDDEEEDDENEKTEAKEEQEPLPDDQTVEEPPAVEETPGSGKSIIIKNIKKNR